MTQPEVIESLRIMDKSIEKSLKTGNIEDLIEFYEQGSILEKIIPYSKEHIHIPNNLEYLLFHLNWAPIYNFSNKPAPGYIHLWVINIWKAVR